jgi:hypothetical protein
MKKIPIVASFFLVVVPIVCHAQFGAAILSGLLRGATEAALSPQRTPDKVLEKVNKSEEEKFPEPTRLELRVMQTRQFNKDPKTVMKAITELFADKSIPCGATGMKMIPSDIKDLPPEETILPGGGKQIRTGLKSIGSLKADAPAKQYCGNYTFEISVKDIVDTTGKGLNLSTQDTMYFQLGLPPPNYEMPGPTFVRARITIASVDRPRTGTPAQSFNPKVYQNIFKEIADGLFIDAIELNPAEMQ